MQRKYQFHKERKLITNYESFNYELVGEGVTHDGTRMTRMQATQISADFFIVQVEGKKHAIIRLKIRVNLRSEIRVIRVPIQRKQPQTIYESLDSFFGTGSSPKPPHG